MTDPKPATTTLSLPMRKLIHMAVLLSITVIAGWLISTLTDEREDRQRDVLSDVTRSWGPEQQVRTPLLVVPYQRAADQPRQYLKIAPIRLKADVNLAPEQRRRGLFRTTVYTARAEFQGMFEVPNEAKLAELVGAASRIYWSDSVVMVEAPALAGMTPRDNVSLGNESRAWRNCREVLNRESDCQGIGAVLAQPRVTEALKPEATLPFRMTLTLRGTNSYTLLPHGRELDVGMTAPWPTPSFIGTSLPASYDIGNKQFNAQWQGLGQDTPHIWSTTRAVEASTKGPSLGVGLPEATPTYRVINRVSKYSILFVTLAFATYFLFELLSGLRIHIFQYGLLGVSLILFPLLLLSFSEPLGYALGYGLSATMILAQASIYTVAVARRTMPAVIFATMLTTLFGFLYVVLSLETYSLLVGSLALFVVLSVVMALTQRIDWRAGAEA